MNSLLRPAVAAMVALGLAAGSALAAGGGDTPKNKDLAQAWALLGKGGYAEAIPLLEKVVAAEPKNADAYNYLGFSHRKLGDTEAALGFYRRALEVLDKACFFGCDEYSDLKKAIKAYKKRNGG
jgi:Flp pilus assembly protein TadD